MMREYITSFRFLVARSIVLPFLPDCGAGAAENNPSEFLSAAPTRKKIVPFSGKYVKIPPRGTG